MKPMDLIDDIVLFDIDGVLGKYDFGELGIKIIPEHEWVRKNMIIDAYTFIQKTNIFDELIRSKNTDELNTLSVAFSSFEQRNKIRFLKENYNNISENGIIFVAKDEFKVDILKELRNIYDIVGKKDKRIVLIEDNVGIMASVEELKNDMIKCYLISDFI